MSVQPFGYVYAWAQTKYGPSLPGRKGERCRVLCQGRDGKRLIQFEDGLSAVVLFRSIRIAEIERD